MTIASHSMPQALKIFKIEYPRTPLKIYSENVDQIQKRLLNGDIDVAFTEGFETNYDFESRHLSTYALFLVCSTESPFAEKKCIDQEDLLQLPFLLREKGSTLRDCFDEVTHSLNISITPILESINTEVLINAVQSKMGLTVLPEPMAVPYLKEHTLTIVEIMGKQMSTANYSVTLKGKAQSKRLQHMIHCFEEAEK